MKRHIKIVSAALVLAGLGWAVLGRTRPGAVPDADFEPISLATITQAPDAEFTIQPAAPLNGKSVFVLMVFVDGMQESRFSALLAAGKLPHLQQLIADRPSTQWRAQGTFPASTAPSIPEVLSGTYPSRHTIGPDKIHAFDRYSGKLLRYEVESTGWDSDRATLFDLVTASGGTALSYFEGYFSGASLNVHDELLYLVDIAEDKVRAAHIGDYDERMVRDFSSRMALAGQVPNLVFLRLGAVDTAGHFYGASSPQYASAIETVDARVGELLELLRLAQLPDGAPLLDQTALMLFSDHGMSDTTAHLNLDRVLRDQGFDPWPTSDPRAIIATYLDDKGAQEHDAVAVPGGSNVSAIYLRDHIDGGMMPWSKKLPGQQLRAFPMPSGPVDVVAALLAEPGVAEVIYLQDPHTLRAERREGGVTIRRKLTPTGDWMLAYQPDDAEADPFGYCALDEALCCPAGEPAEACFASVDTWAARTASSPLPSVPFLLFKSVSGPSQTRPDLVVTAAPGWGFMAEVQGDHGALRPELLWVPLLVSGPGFAPKQGPARLVDVFPTALTLLGLEPLIEGLQLDGRSLVEPALLP